MLNCSECVWKPSMDRCHSVATEDGHLVEQALVVGANGIDGEEDGSHHQLPTHETADELQQAAAVQYCVHAAAVPPHGTLRMAADGRPPSGPRATGSLIMVPIDMVNTSFS